MKTLQYIAFGLIAFLCTPVLGQVSVNVNVGSRPAWGPPVTVEEYYYLPDVESYYDIRSSQFIYLNNGNWVRARSLPSRYRGYDLNRGNVIVINDYHGQSPYVHYKTHKVKYVKKWHKDNGNHRGNGKHKGKGKRD